MLWSAAFLFCLPAVSRAADPDPATSEYLRTVSGLFVYSKLDNSNRLNIGLAPLKPALGRGSLYLEARFGNPQRRAEPLTKHVTVPAGSRQPVFLSSPPLHSMQDGRAYMVTVLIYADAAHKKLLGIHKQAIVYHALPEDIFRQLGSERGR